MSRMYETFPAVGKCNWNSHSKKNKKTTKPMKNGKETEKLPARNQSSLRVAWKKRGCSKSSTNHISLINFSFCSGSNSAFFSPRGRTQREEEAVGAVDEFSSWCPLIGFHIDESAPGVLPPPDVSGGISAYGPSDAQQSLSRSLAEDSVVRSRGRQDFSRQNLAERADGTAWH